MRALRENLVVQFSVVSFVIMLVIIAGISVIFSVTFNNLVERMGVHDSAMHADIMIAPTDPASFENIVRSVINLRWVSYITVGGGFVVLYGGLVFIVWGGWRTISRQQRSLVASETRFRSFIENSLDIVTVLDVDGTIRYASPSIEWVLGYEPVELTGKNVFELIHPEDASTIMEVFTNSLQNPDAPPSRELRFFRFLHKNGSWRDLEAVGNRFLEDSQVVGFVVNSRDISERKRVEEALQVHTDDVARSNKELAAEISQRMQAEANLRESEERFRRLSDAAFEAVVIHEMGEVIEVNQAFTKMLGYEPSEIIGKSILDLIDPAYRDEVFERICSQDETPIEAMGLKKDGTSIFVEANAKTIPYEGRVARVTALRDITERKRAEEQISASLKEKEVLLKEIHHRVKNNLQVISSLLYLQSDYIKDQATKDMFKESQNRVRSMALIHEKLYQTDDLANVDFSDYTKKLTADLLRSYGLNPMAVTIQISIEDVFLGVDTAIPCGLIINELVSNALKYAFPEGRDGVIRVDLRAGDENTFTLIVGDNGVGFPKGMDFQNTDTLGLELVNMLTKQIGGTVELHNTNGTEFRIAFPEYNEFIEVEVTG